MTFISWFNMSDLSLHEHAMYEHYVSDYDSVGPFTFADHYNKTAI